MAGDLHDLLALARLSEELITMVDLSEDQEDILVVALGFREDVAEATRNLMSTFENCEKAHRRAHGLSGDKNPPVVCFACFPPPIRSLLTNCSLLSSSTSLC